MNLVLVFDCYVLIVEYFVLDFVDDVVKVVFGFFDECFCCVEFELDERGFVEG